jgi:hypothetical protein
MAAALSRDPRAWVLALAVLLPMVTALEKPGVLSGKIMSPGLSYARCFGRVLYAGG